MKKILLSFIVMIFAANLNFAQVTLTTAVDFDLVDVHGNNVHLFDILDNGQYVVIEFWASW